MRQEPQAYFRTTDEKPVGFWSLDVRTRLTTMDGLMSAYFGIAEQVGARGVPSQAFIDRIPSDYHAHVLSKTQEAIETRGYVTYVYGIRREDDRIRMVKALGRCFTNATGDPTHIAGILYEVDGTERVPAVVQIIESLLAAREMAKTIDEEVLSRLIDAVLLEAGRAQARAMNRESGRHRMN